MKDINNQILEFKIQQQYLEAIKEGTKTMELRTLRSVAEKYRSKDLADLLLIKRILLVSEQESIVCDVNPIICRFNTILYENSLMKQIFINPVGINRINEVNNFMNITSTSHNSKMIIFSIEKYMANKVEKEQLY